jgi:hypothetical protein
MNGLMDFNRSEEDEMMYLEHELDYIEETRFWTREPSLEERLSPDEIEEIYINQKKFKINKLKLKSIVLYNEFTRITAKNCKIRIRK